MSTSDHSAANRPIDNPSQRQSELSFMARLLRPHRSALALTMILLLSQSLIALAHPWLAGKFAAAVLAGTPVQSLMWSWLVLIGMQSLLSWFTGVRLQETETDLSTDVGVRAFDHLQSLPLAWHHDRPHGEVLSLLTQDANRLGYFLVGTLSPLLPQLMICAGALLMMFRIAPWFAVAAAALVPGMYLAMKLAGRRLRPLGQKMMQGFAAKSAIAGQSLTMLPVIKAFTGEPIESSRFRAESASLREVQITLARHSGLIAPMVRFVSAAAILILLSLAGRAVASGTLTAEALVSLLLYGLLLTQPISALASTFGQVHVALGSVRRLQELFAQAPEPDGGLWSAEQVRGEITYEQVGFRHPGRERVLDRLDLALAAGETVAITGENGSGKSTLIHLLMRFSDPEEGRILLDGRDLREYQLGNLRRHIGLVSQTVLLFDASVGENIVWGRPGASQPEIEAAARLAQAHEFIQSLPEGYATRIGDRGVKLSGGQQQRLSLARALLKAPAVLILDEATAMFDPAAERAFVQEFHAHGAQRTVILITHRPASLTLADRVLRMESGSLLPAGTA